MLVGELNLLDSLISTGSRTDSARKSALDTMMQPCRQDSKYLQQHTFVTPGPVVVRVYPYQPPEAFFLLPV